MPDMSKFRRVAKAIATGAVAFFAPHLVCCIGLAAFGAGSAAAVMTGAAGLALGTSLAVGVGVATWAIKRHRQKTGKDCCTDKRAPVRAGLVNGTGVGLSLVASTFLLPSHDQHQGHGGHDHGGHGGHNHPSATVAPVDPQPAAKPDCPCHEGHGAKPAKITARRIAAPSLRLG